MNDFGAMIELWQKQRQYGSVKIVVLPPRLTSGLLVLFEHVLKSGVRRTRDYEKHIGMGMPTMWLAISQVGREVPGMRQMEFIGRNTDKSVFSGSFQSLPKWGRTAAGGGLEKS